jgi:hypothetical protein
MYLAVKIIYHITLRKVVVRSIEVFMKAEKSCGT